MDNLNLLFNAHLVDKVDLQTKKHAFKNCIKDFNDGELKKEEFSCFSKFVDQLNKISDEYKKNFK